MWMPRRFVVGILLAHHVALAAPPLTPLSPVMDTYHGTTVIDPYRWLEDWGRPEVRRWSDKQNTIARGVLDQLPGVSMLRQEVTAAFSAEMVRYRSVQFVGDRLFALKYQPPKQQPFIVVMSSWNRTDDAQVVVDPNQIDATGATTIDWYKVSPNGQYLAVSLSEGGTELGTLRIYDIDRAKIVFESIERINSGTAGGSLAWTTDSQGFFYTRHFSVEPAASDDHRVYQHVYYHRLGTDPADDGYELGEGFPEIAEIQLAASRSSGHVLATVQEGDGGQFAHYLRDPDGRWRQFSQFGDGIKQAVFGPRGQLLLVSLQDAPHGKLVAIDLDRLELTDARLVIDATDDTIVTGGTPFWGDETVVPTENRIYVVYQTGGPSVVRAFDLQGRPLAEIPQFDIGAVHGLVALQGDDLLFGNSSYLQPDAYYYYSAADNATHKSQLASTSPVTLDDAVVLRRFARSQDGTRVPLNIIMNASASTDGQQPCLVTGYGGYGVNNEPAFSLLSALLVHHGFLVVETNLRGGGEYGETWHQHGNLTRKQNVFDDFAACIRYMIDEGYTRPQRLGIMGGSNGGLLMGATLTQHPERIGAVVSYVGIYDMLRVELSANGAFNVTEFGSVKDRDQFEALYSYSPYHNVIDGVAYPATLFLTGATIRASTRCSLAK